jgi:hypothetical protein
MRGVELSPASAIVRPYREAMFCAHNISGTLAGLMVGSRARDDEAWKSAIDEVTVTCVVSCGHRLNIGPWQDLIASGDLGWPLFGTARSPFVVYVRNDRPELVELRAVVVLQGGAVDRARPARRRLR